MALLPFFGTARASGALQAAGAFDTTPIVLSTNTMNEITFLCKYTRGGAGGSVTYKLEYSNDGTNWYQNSDTEIGPVVGGADDTNSTQRANNVYQATSASAESFTTQTFEVLGNFCRLNVKESGNVGSPGTFFAEFYARRDV
jgi:hypothetical protein